MTTSYLKLTLAAALVLSASTVSFAQFPNRTLINPNTGVPTGYYSPRLGARFEIQTISIPGYTFQAARIVSVPAFNSPLRQLGLNVGDVITRLDGTPVTNYFELERHAYRTSVRFIKDGTTYPRELLVFIPFQNPTIITGGLAP